MFNRGGRGGATAFIRFRKGEWTLKMMRMVSPDDYGRLQDTQYLAVLPPLCTSSESVEK